MENEINRYLSYHEVNEFRQRNLIFTWMLWNYGKLKILFENESKFKNKDLFKSLLKEINSDLYLLTFTNNGSYRASNKSYEEKANGRN